MELLTSQIYPSWELHGTIFFLMAARSYHVRRSPDKVLLPALMPRITSHVWRLTMLATYMEEAGPDRHPRPEILLRRAVS